MERTSLICIFAPHSISYWIESKELNSHLNSCFKNDNETEAWNFKIIIVIIIINGDNICRKFKKNHWIWTQKSVSKSNPFWVFLWCTCSENWHPYYYAWTWFHFIHERPTSKPPMIRNVHKCVHIKYSEKSKTKRFSSTSVASSSSIPCIKIHNTLILTIFFLSHPQIHH